MDVMLFIKAVLYAQSASRKSAPKHIYVFCLALPLLVTGLLGFRAAKALPSADPVAIGNAIFMAMAILSLMVGLWEGGYTLRFESLLPFQPRPWELFLAELSASLMTPARRVMWLFGIVFIGGTACTRPIFALWLLPFLVIVMAALVFLERLVGSASRLMAGSFKTVVLFLGVLALLKLLMTQLRTGLSGGTKLAMPEWSAASLPLIQTAKGWQMALDGKYPTSACILAPMAWMAFLGMLVYLMVRRDLSGGSMLTQCRNSPPALWNFESAWAGVARQHLHTILRTKVGRFLPFMPLIGLFATLDAFLFRMEPGPTFIVAAMGWVFLPLGTKLACALFGFDRGGVRSFWLFPLEDRDIILGKVAGTFIYQMAILLISLLVLTIATSMHPWLLLASFLFGLSLCFNQLAIGLRYSLAHPRPMDMAGFNTIEMDGAKTAMMGALLLPWIILVMLFLICSHISLPCLLIALSCACLLSLARLVRAVPVAVTSLDDHRERMTFLLEGGS